MKQEIVKGWILFKTGFPQDLHKESIHIYKTREEAEFALDGYTHGVARYLTPFPVKIIIDL